MRLLLPIMVLAITLQGVLSLKCYSCKNCGKDMDDYDKRIYSTECTSTDPAEQPVCRKMLGGGSSGYPTWIRDCVLEPKNTPIGNCIVDGCKIDLCESCNTDGCNDGQLNGTNLGLVSTSKPYFSKDEMDRLNDCILESIIEIFDENLRPKFMDVRLRTGFILFTVLSDTTESWLREHADAIGGSCGLPFMVVKGNDIPHFYLVKGKFNDAGKLPEANVLKFIEAQNANLHATKWTIIKSRKTSMDARYLMSIDDVSADQLRKNGGNIYFRLGVNTLTFVDDEDTLTNWWYP